METNTLLIVAAVALVFSNLDKLRTATNRVKLWVKVKTGSNRMEYMENRINTVAVHIAKGQEQSQGELNHIKGQGQEVLHRLENLHTVAAVDGAAIREVLGKLNTMGQNVPHAEELIKIRATVESMANAMQAGEGLNNIYMEALGGLAKSESAILERLQKQEQLLVSIVAALNRLTTGA
jgi:transcriptional regulator NrdR family protein